MYLRTTFLNIFLVPDCRCTRLSHLYPPDCRCTRLSHPCTRLSLYPFVALVPVCPCTRLSHHLYPFVPVPNCRLPLYPIVPVPNCRQLLYPIVPVPNCRICTRLSLYPTVPVPNYPRTRLSGTGKINDTKNAISHELLGLDLEQNFKKENSWFCMLQAVAAINKRLTTLNFFSAVDLPSNSRKQVIFSNNYIINKWV